MDVARSVPRRAQVNLSLNWESRGNQVFMIQLGRPAPMVSRGSTLKPSCCSTTVNHDYIMRLRKRVAIGFSESVGYVCVRRPLPSLSKAVIFERLWRFIVKR